jgi:hypothetical protein
MILHRNKYPDAEYNWNKIHVYGVGAILVEIMKQIKDHGGILESTYINVAYDCSDYDDREINVYGTIYYATPKSESEKISYQKMIELAKIRKNEMDNLIKKQRLESIDKELANYGYTITPKSSNNDEVRDNEGK